MRRRARECDVCGRGYYRRSLIEGWTTQTPGSRQGWVKSHLRVCPACAPGPVVLRVMMVAQVRPVTSGRGRLRRRVGGGA